jgi:glycosyltransferase involved in cell wall biosynthesis
MERHSEMLAELVLEAEPMARVRLLFVANDAPYFRAHWQARALAAQAAGYDVHVAVPRRDARELVEFADEVHQYALQRRSLRPWRELGSILDLIRLYQRLRPDIVHHLTIKPVVYGGLAARIAGVPAVVNAITGLGVTFVEAGWRRRLFRGFVEACYRVALGHGNSRTTFENPDDRKLFIDCGLVAESRAVLILGSGIDLEEYCLPDHKADPPLVILASRMLWPKGVAEYVEAARLLKAEGHAARFALIGTPDTQSPAAIPIEQLRAWHDEGAVEWWGWRDDMPAILADASVVCLPTWYREGVPRVLIEAAAAGAALVATDAPGCREIVLDERTGFLVPQRDPVALADAVRRLLTQPALRADMGRAGRDLAEHRFAMDVVLRSTLDQYTVLSSGAGHSTERVHRS